MRILFAVDESEYSEAAVRWAATQIRPKGTDALVLHMLSLHEQLASSYETTAQAAIQEQLTKVVFDWPNCSIPYGHDEGAAPCLQRATLVVERDPSILHAANRRFRPCCLFLDNAHGHPCDPAYDFRLRRIVKPTNVLARMRVRNND